MPCYDSQSEREYYAGTGDYAKTRISAFLCAILTSLESERGALLTNVIENIDEEKAGITKQEIYDWWENHKEQEGRR